MIEVLLINKSKSRIVAYAKLQNVSNAGIMASIRASNASLALCTAQIARQLNVTKEILSPTKIRVCIPGGFPYEAFNGKACVRPWSVIRMVECSRAVCFNDPRHPFLDIHKLYENNFVFIAATRTELSPKLYDHSVVKAPLYVDVLLDYVGNKTFKLKTSFFVQDRDPICTNNVQSVFVDGKTRKSTEPPLWWKEKYAAGLEPGHPLKISPLAKPEHVECMDYRFQIPGTDVDFYYHTNWSNFIKYYYNAYVSSIIRSVETVGHQEVFRNLKNFSLSFLKESRAGDEVRVLFWQNENNVSQYHFQMFKKSDLINECSLEFYS